MFDIQENLQQLLAEAPVSLCGACRVPMEAHTVDVTVSVNFDWHLEDRREVPPRADGATDFDAFAAAWPDPTRYTGNVEYVCPRCGVRMLHRQVVTCHGDGFHFQAPDESGVA